MGHGVGLVSFATGPLYSPKSEKRSARRSASALINELSSGLGTAEAGARTPSILHRNVSQPPLDFVYRLDSALG